MASPSTLEKSLADTQGSLARSRLVEATAALNPPPRAHVPRLTLKPNTGQESLALRVAHLEDQLDRADASNPASAPTPTSGAVREELTTARAALREAEEKLRTESESCRHLAAAVAQHREALRTETPACSVCPAALLT